MPDEPRWLAGIAETTAQLEYIFGDGSASSVLLRHVRELRLAAKRLLAAPRGTRLARVKQEMADLLVRQEPPCDST